MNCKPCARTVNKLKRMVERAPKEVAVRRINICKQCDKLKYGHCSICYCNMFVKTKLKNSECDLKKW